MNKKYTLFSAIVVALVIVFIFFANNNAVATHQPNVSGWGWSSNIGWVSFNSDNCDANEDGLSDGTHPACPPAGSSIPDYGVNQDEAGNLTGYAWSSNVGWLSFEPSDVTGCPIGPCTPRVNLATGLLSGWGKFLNGNPSSGWDGWVSLAGDTQDGGGYVVTFNATDSSYSGFAWGADVIGWFEWSDVIFTGDGPAIIASCAVNKSTARLSENVIWTVTASGGNGTYTYLWHGTPPLAGRTGISETVQYDSFGNKQGSVTVSSPGSNPVTTEPCLNPLGDQGIDVQPRLTTGVTGAGPGVVTTTPPGNDCSTTCNYDIDNNTQVTLTFDPNDGTKFLRWVDQSGNPSPLCVPATSPVCTFTISGDVTIKAETRKTQCDNGVDDLDPEDSLADEADPGCHTDGNSNNPNSYNPNDDNEGTGNQCSDGVDNNDPEDTLADEADPGCHSDGDADNPDSYNPNDTSENDPFETTCDDGEDQGGDGLCDWAGCTIGGNFLPADPTCGGNPFNNTEGDEGDIHEI